jgi:hypothetical protein
MFLRNGYSLAVGAMLALAAAPAYADEAMTVTFEGDARNRRRERDPAKAAISIPQRLEPREFSTADIERMARADARRAAKVARQARGFVTPNPSDHQHPGEER